MAFEPCLSTVGRGLCSLILNWMCWIRTAYVLRKARTKIEHGIRIGFEISQGVLPYIRYIPPSTHWPYSKIYKSKVKYRENRKFRSETGQGFQETHRLWTYMAAAGAAPLSLPLSPLSSHFLFAPSLTREPVHKLRNSPQAPTQFSLECPPGLDIRHRLYTGVKGNVWVAKRSCKVILSSTILVHLLKNKVLLLRYTQEYLSRRCTVTTKTELKFAERISDV